MSPCKAVAWNFKNVVPGGCGTVEFRRPPQVTSSAATKLWIAFSLCFINYAVHYCNLSELSNLTAEPTKTDLREAIFMAASHLDSVRPYFSPRTT